MIHYALRCAAGHAFDGWFQGSAGFEDQAAKGLIGCPACGTTAVERALMAPNLGRKGSTTSPAAVAVPQAGQPPPPSGGSPGKPPAGASGGPSGGMPDGLPDGLRAKLMRLRAEVEKRCVYVGPDFATEARAIHDGTAAPRPIYGEATPAEADALRDDGVDIASIPWVRADS